MPKKRLDAARLFIEVFRTAALQAGSVARRLQGKVCVENKPGETTPEGAALTAVDLAAQDVILQLLHTSFPEAAVDAEEDTETVSLFPPPRPDRPLIIIDPIDGTLNYSQGSKDYAVMGAFMTEGVYRAALIYFPALAEMYWAVQGEGCRFTRQGEREQIVHLNSPPSRVLVPPWFWTSWKRTLRSVGFHVDVSRCSAVDASVGANHRAAAAVSRGRPDRRRSIGYLLTLEAGGLVKFGDYLWCGEDPLSYPAASIRMAIAGTPEAVEKISPLRFG